MSGSDGRRRGRPAWVLAAVLAATLPAAPAPASMARTYTSAPGVVIPDALPPSPGSPRSVTDVIEVPDGGAIRDVDVAVSIRHPSHGDLTLALTEPGGAVTVQLIATEGGPGDGFVNVVFDDEATGMPPGFAVDGTCLVDQTYQPAPGTLAEFDGLELHGVWTLTVTDHFSIDATDCDCDLETVGPDCPRTLDEWSLIVEFDSPADDDGSLPTLGCSEVLLLLAAIVVLLGILWLLVVKTRP